MRFMNPYKKRFAAGLAVLALSIITGDATGAQAPLTGAIFTTDKNSSFVNANVYDDLGAVYLNGGPRPNAPCTASGLPNGAYYFQVTDPSGKVLLSTDDVENRKVQVSEGVITEYLGSLEPPHLTGLGKCPGSISVGLFPYAKTPNAGGEYKVWMTPAEEHVPDDPSSSFGFLPHRSKTDNFKVSDSDGDGIPDEDILARLIIGIAVVSRLL
jgi:hypothetical protein